MFGYICVNRSELKLRELSEYQSWYCGLCGALRERYGVSGQLTLSYDMSFLSILLSSLYEDRVRVKKGRCLPHPLKKHDTRRTVFSDYGADMNILLSYYNMLDDWKDDGSVISLLQSGALKKSVERVTRDYPRQSAAIKDYVSELGRLEKDDGGDIEAAASMTGRMLGEIFVRQEDEWSDELRCMGFFLGKFIYLMDAYEDIEKDIKKGSYNPLKKLFEEKDFDTKCREMLAMQMSECCRAFEKLPLIRDVGILRNILYSGVWTSFARVYRSRNNIRPR